MWVFDATPLIYLGAVEPLTLGQYLEGARVLPERVYDEVVNTGLEQCYPDARRIERAVEADHVDVVAVETTPLLERP
jgi:hypothetical protein